MDFAEKDIPTLLLDGQELFLPSLKSWQTIIERGTFLGMQVISTDWISGWLQEFGHFDVASLALHRAYGRWMITPLLFLNGEYFRVHYENVICEHCQRRCGASATPDFGQYPSSVAQDMWARIMALPVENCPHCNGELHRRHTLWLHQS